jgi:parallel beta-helix repeat protein
MKKKLIGIFVCMLLIGTVLPVSGIEMVERTPISTSLGDTLYVGGSGPGNYSTIQEAIDNASDGDTVFVYDDSSPYNESIDVNKSIKLIGENRETTIIEGHIDVLTNWVNISEFTIQRGLHIFSCNNIIITGNRITDTFFSMGIWLIATSNIIIRFNTIHNNRFGLVVVQCINSIIEKNNFIDNRIHAYFSFIVRNFWDSNYWDNWIGIRQKLIFGSLGLIGIIPWINLDRNPAQEPYDI